MSAANSKKKKDTPWLAYGGLGLFFLVAIGFLVKVIVFDPAGPPKKQVQVITLIKPPPPEVKEKPPEPEVPKETPKQQIETPTEAPTPQNQPDQADDSPPAGDNLSVDGDGGAGDNAFGLGAKKGGRAITLGGNGGGGQGKASRLSLLAKYGGYSRQMKVDISKKVKEVLEQNGGRPKGLYVTRLHLTLSPQGRVLKFAIEEGSGVERLDRAFEAALTGLKMSEPPPEGMPLAMTLEIKTKG